MRRYALVGSVSLLFLVLVVATSLQGTPTIDPPEFGGLEAPPPSAPGETGAPMPVPTQTGVPNPVVNSVISTLFLIVLAVVAVLLVVLIIRLLARAWKDRALRRRPAGRVDESLTAADEAPVVEAPVIRRGILAAMSIIDQRPEPSDAIVAAWVGLEETAADAGIVRGATETPAEFTVRILTGRGGIEPHAGELLALYERVRFGGYPASEADRSQAHTALAAIEEGWR